jgi:hypothetical protein
MLTKEEIVSLVNRRLNRVLLIEAGPEDKSPLIAMPKGFGKLLSLRSSRDAVSVYSRQVTAYVCVGGRPFSSSSPR